jgi:hypothetical protein
MAVSPDEIMLSEAQKLHVALLAEQTGRPWTELLGEALAGYRPKPDPSPGNGGESFYDAAMRLGLIGCVRGGPPDLSTNPEYLEGFGTRAT